MIPASRRTEICLRTILPLIPKRLPTVSAEEISAIRLMASALTVNGGIYDGSLLIIVLLYIYFK